MILAKLRDWLLIGTPGERVMMIDRLKKEALAGKPHRGSYTYTMRSRKRHCDELQALANRSRLARVYGYEIQVKNVLEYGFHITLSRAGDQPIIIKAYYWQRTALGKLMNHPYYLAVDGGEEVTRVKQRIQQLNASLKEKAKWKKKNTK